MKKLKEFKNMCPGEYAELKEAITTAAKERNCLIKLNPNKVLVEAEDPFNSNGTVTYKLDYTSSVVNEIYAIFDELDDILRTAYQPLYISMIPMIKAHLDGIITGLTYDEYEAFLIYADGKEGEVFGYNATDYEKFVEHISELITSVTATLKISDKEPCKNHAEHCGKCNNATCERNNHDNLIKVLWCNLTPQSQQHVKEVVGQKMSAELKKIIG